MIKGVYSQRKEFAPNGSKFFPFREDQEGVNSFVFDLTSFRRFLVCEKQNKTKQKKKEVTKIVSPVEKDGGKSFANFTTP